MKYSKDIKTKDNYDVIVTGAGPAGICAAVSSARLGAKTLLVERYGSVGGNLTLGMVGPVTGNVGKGTILDEINRIIGGDYPRRWVQDYETAKIALTRLLHDEKVTLYLQAQAVDSIMKENRISGIIMASPEGMHASLASVVVDATGNGCVAYHAGADHKIGSDDDNELQPVSLMFKLGGVDDDEAISEGNHTYDVRMPDSGFREFCENAAKAGEIPQNASFVRLYRTARKGECVVNATQDNGIDGTKVADIARAEINLRAQIPIIIKFLQRNVRGFEGCFLQESASTLGVRETRRIIGDYVLTENDLFAGRRFSDVIVHDALYNIDIHNPTGGGMREFTAVRPYDIPYRCILPRGIENLLTAGRCISGTHRAQASYRVMSICMALGQAAGMAAALSCSCDLSPRLLDPGLIQKELMEYGAELF